MEKKIVVEFEMNEVQVLATLIDTAVKTLGLQAARAAITLTDKIDMAINASNKPAEEVKEEPQKK